ncbi:MAG: asparagine synthase (glutamine-hydrolyzing) [Pseudomonadales bacterium]
MCGIAGFISQQFSEQAAVAALGQMGLAIEHRGPDDHGTYFDATQGVGLCHQRLSIIDLSPAGHQPMASSSSRYITVFNGEIYNHSALRSELISKGHSFRGGSDTEVLLACLDEYGIHDTLKKLVGMFAIAIWDSESKDLYLVRDRMGEKPLYYEVTDKRVVFGSELNAIKAFPEWSATIDQRSLTQLLQLGYITAPNSIYESVHKVLPGKLIKIQIRNQQCQVSEETYWSVYDVAQAGLANPFPDYQTAKASIHAQLRESIALQSCADVPLGAFLSGGVDSSVVVGIMQSLSSQQVRTFTIGFHEKDFNEAEHAKQVASHLGTAHEELYLSATQARDVIPSLPAIFDEPFADVSQIPTYLVSKVAKSGVTVSLSGDAGDELFIGYHRYFLAERVFSKLRKLPLSARRTIAKLVNNSPQKLIKLLAKATESMLPGDLRTSSMYDKLLKLTALLDSANEQALYRHIISFIEQDNALTLNKDNWPSSYDEQAFWGWNTDYQHKMALADMNAYLPDDILVKVDRSAMALSLETRAPFLDHRLVEQSWRIPPVWKHSDGVGKLILKDILYEYVPRELVERPKMGFGVPLGHWLRHDLRDWAEDLLQSDRIREEGLLDHKKVSTLWQEHLDGTRDWQYHLWNVLTFQAWYRSR